MKRYAELLRGLAASVAVGALLSAPACWSGDFVVARVRSQGGSSGTGDGGSAGVPSAGALASAGASGEAGAPTRSCNGNVLFVVGPDPLTRGDSAILDRLRGLGFVVSIISATDVTTQSAEDVDLAFISRSVRSPEVNPSFRDLPTPLFVTEHALYSSLGMTGDQPEDSGVDTLSVTDLTIVDATHPLAAGLSGIVTVLEPGKGQYGFGVPGPSAVVVANLVDETRGAAIFAYDEGTDMVGLVAPARRIGWFLDIQAATRFTPEGWTLFDAAVAWTAGRCASP
jgi:hypothetical protein